MLAAKRLVGSGEPKGAMLFEAIHKPGARRATVVRAQHEAIDIADFVGRVALAVGVAGLSVFVAALLAAIFV